MRKEILVFLVACLFIATNAFAVGNFNVTGNLGVGTTSPSQKLEVQSGDVLVKGSNNWQNNGDEAKYIMGDTNHYIKTIRGTGVKIGTYNASDGICLLESTGKVGIGTATPNSKLQIYDGDIFINGVNNFSSNGDEAKVTFGDSNHYIRSIKGAGVAIGTWNAADGITLRESTGNVGIGTTDPTTKLDVNSDKIRVRTAKTPSSASDTGSTGDVCWDSSYVYICVGTNTWKRALLSTW